MWNLVFITLLSLMQKLWEIFVFWASRESETPGSVIYLCLDYPPLQGGPRIYLTLSEEAMIFLAPSIVTGARCQERCLAVCVWAKPTSKHLFFTSMWEKAAAVDGAAGCLAHVPFKAAVRAAWCTSLLGECITKITRSLRRLVSSL